jgi:hypothetical protein
MNYFLNKKWICILIGVIIFIPIALNLLIILPNLFPIVGDGKIWLSFWGSYISSLLSSLIAIFILYKQIGQNHSENESNRNLQLKNIEFQQQIQWLNNLKVKMVEYYVAFSYNDIYFLGDKILKNEGKEKEEIREITKVIMDKMSTADFSKGILFPPQLDEVEKGYLIRIKNFTEEFNSLFEDIDWYVCNVAFFAGSFEMNKKLYTTRTTEYKQERHQNASACTRIWDLIEKYNYDVFNHYKDIISARMTDAMEKFSKEKVQRVIIELIDYEQKKIDKILTS